MSFHFLKRHFDFNFDDGTKKIREGELTEKEIYEALASIASNKFPGNDGLTKEFYYTFWNEVKDTFIDFLRESKVKKILSFSKRQAIIKTRVNSELETNFSFKC